jgi:hypothetical protein
MHFRTLSDGPTKYRTDEGIGNILSRSGLQAAVTLDADTIPSRQATLQTLEHQSGQPLVRYIESTLDLLDDPESTSGVFESLGIFGRILTDQFRVDGNYTFHAKATYGTDCTGTRELVWTIAVAIGIDSGKTDVNTQPIGTRPDGSECMHMTFTPRDRYGNYLGPGRADAFEIQPQPGSTLSSSVKDLGNGSYEVDICWDPASIDPPRIGLVQPGRPPVVVGSAELRRYIYSIKFLCGEQKEDCCGYSPVRPGQYSTDINIHNFHEREVSITKRIIPLIMTGAVRGREPNVVSATSIDKIKLPAHSATMDDCFRILELLLGAKPTGPVPLTVGLIEIISPIELNVTAVYTTTDPNNKNPSIDVESIVGNVVNSKSEEQGQK